MSTGTLSIGSKAAKNSIYSMISNLWYLGSRFLLTPFILHYLSLAEYGLWSLCFVVISFLSLTSMGFEGAYIKYVAQFHASDQIDKANRVLSTGLLLTSTISVVLLALVWGGMELLLSLLQIETEFRQTASFLLLGTVAVFALDISFNCFGRALDGLQLMALTARVRVGTSVIELILIVVFLMTGHGVNGLMWAFLIRFVLNILANMYYAYRLVPGLQVRLGLCDTESLKLLLRYGGKMQLLGALSILMVTFDRLIITRFLGLAANGMYEIGRKIPFTGAKLPTDISGAVMPALSQLQAQGQVDLARRLYLDASRYMGILTAVLFTYLIAVAPWAIQVWLGDGYELAVGVMYATCVGKLIHLLTGGSSAAARGLDRLDWELRSALINVVLGVVLVPLLTYYFALVGAATGVAISTAVASVYFIVITNRHFLVGLGEYASFILKPLACAALSAAIVYWVGDLLVQSFTPNRIVLAGWLVVAGLLHLSLCFLLLLSSRGLQPAEIDKLKNTLTSIWMRLGHRRSTPSTTTDSSTTGTVRVVTDSSPVIKDKE